ncbi:SIP/FAR complex FHA domain subunit Csc1 [Schizosaccharomyces pombe]|uniref:Uncharacterized protein C3H7.13 n=1 Tax=Schizosaccharomyces pombe (strain 972 / ATCC 24843) TaxID=284812 RepID=YNVD_SCHPO|nr:putative FHA domain protein Far10 [Schizosaccharomyces pombe]O74388.1 RecName: Full=Uncharacterized protein C3H7.13 [Schizosaccharomyces pombe 972h-]CAA20309.1 FHA domain protein Far10 (predicted) [Schizosaccharomyces pombe]|eukprot:NP_595762.1 putative FHA domain protein Far10 [Schizosaccharomyces pombe]
MSAVITLTPLNESFQTKKLVISPSTIYKIGRHTNKSTSPSPSNLFFNSKVLSRQHAELWLDKDTLSVYIRDVKSSNGTFVNETRLSPENKPSAPCKLNSGDIVDFGVDIYNEDEIVHQKVSAQVRIVVRGATFATTPARSLDSEVMLDSIMRQMVFQYQRCVELNENLESLENGVEEVSKSLSWLETGKTRDNRNNHHYSRKSSPHISSLAVPSTKHLDGERDRNLKRSTSPLSSSPFVTEAALNEAELAKTNLEAWKARAFTAEARLSSKNKSWQEKKYLVLSPFFIAVAGIIVYMGYWR